MHLLSKTFQDAIFLARNLGYQYLWINSLCIIQDDANDWRHESSLMASVYGGTALNLAASHARDGSMGCFVDRSPSDVAPCHVPLKGPGLPGTVVCVPSNFYTRGILDTPLGHRAWAFQERLLAPRTLSLSTSQIFWGCQRLEACETFPFGIPSAVQSDISNLAHDNGAASKPTLYGLFQNWPGIWSDIVLGYSGGILTQQDDKLVAVSGVARLQNQVQPDRYLAGLWRTDLEWQLLWSVNSTVTNQYYSSSKDVQPSNVQPVAYRAPSWSWAAVNGIIRHQHPDISRTATSGLRLCIRVVRAATTLVNKTDPFSAVSDGFLQILSCGLLKVDESFLHAPGWKISVDNWPYKKEKKQLQMPLAPVWDYPDEKYASVFFLPVWTRVTPFSSRKRYCGGLLLVPTKKNKYKRVGRAATNPETKGNFHTSRGFTEINDE